MNLRALIIGGHALAGLATALAIWTSCLSAAGQAISALAASRLSPELEADVAALPAALIQRPQVSR